MNRQDISGVVKEILARRLGLPTSQIADEVKLSTIIMSLADFLNLQLEIIKATGLNLQGDDVADATVGKLIAGLERRFDEEQCSQWRFNIRR